MADFEGDFLAERGERGERGDEVRVAVALDHLGGHGGGLQTQPLADALFDLGADVGEGSDGAGDLADAQIFGGGFEALQIAARLPRTRWRVSGRR